MSHLCHGIPICLMNRLALKRILNEKHILVASLIPLNRQASNFKGHGGSGRRGNEGNNNNRFTGK